MLEMLHPAATLLIQHNLSWIDALVVGFVSIGFFIYVTDTDSQKRCINSANPVNKITKTITKTKPKKIITKITKTNIDTTDTTNIMQP